jgi:hypothetical protein
MRSGRRPPVLRRVHGCREPERLQERDRQTVDAGGGRVAATASAPSSLSATCTVSVPIAMIDAWNPIGGRAAGARRVGTR